MGAFLHESSAIGGNAESTIISMKHFLYKSLDGNGSILDEGVQILGKHNFLKFDAIRPHLDPFVLNIRFCF